MGNDNFLRRNLPDLPGGERVGRLKKNPAVLNAEKPGCSVKPQGIALYMVVAVRRKLDIAVGQEYAIGNRKVYFIRGEFKVFVVDLYIPLPLELLRPLIILKVIGQNMDLSLLWISPFLEISRASPAEEKAWREKTKIRAKTIGLYRICISYPGIPYKRRIQELEFRIWE